MFSSEIKDGVCTIKIPNQPDIILYENDTFTYFGRNYLFDGKNFDHIDFIKKGVDRFK